MDCFVGFGTVADADMGVEPDTMCGSEGIVGVDEAAFGGFEVVTSEGVGDTAELERGGTVKGGGGEGNLIYSVYD